MIAYRHTQIGWAIAGSMTLGAVLVLVSSTAQGSPGVGALVALALALAAATFHRLTVTVSDASVRVEFGPGWIARELDLDEVVSCEPVRNRWYWGWGIRYTPRGWLWNVEGLDAVELELTGERRFRIGTDQPWQLCDAIQERLEARR